MRKLILMILAGLWLSLTAFPAGASALSHAPGHGHDLTAGSSPFDQAVKHPHCPLRRHDWSRPCPHDLLKMRPGSGPVFTSGCGGGEGSTLLQLTHQAPVLSGGGEVLTLAEGRFAEPEIRQTYHSVISIPVAPPPEAV